MAPKVRLKPDRDMYPGRDGMWRIASPADRFDRVKLPGDLAGKVARELTGQTNTENYDSEVAAIVDAFISHGYAESELEPNFCVGPVCILGDAPYLNLTAGLLRKAGATTTTTTAPGGIWILGQLNLDDDQMGRWDAEAAQAGVVRHRAFFEGGRWFVGPLTVPGQTASYSDYRARRLAACDVPEELVEYWRVLPGLQRRVPPAGVSALIAGFLVGDVLAVLGGRRSPTAGFQIELNPETLLTTWHPVLPLPGGLW